MSNAGKQVSVGLFSHTNAGKTTLARTLLRSDIGEIGDRAHVTDVSERHVLIESSAGDVLALWDTPGFGDSTRLYQRLKGHDDPVGWALSQPWDRFADRPYWSGQQALRSARECCDVILYVINASELPEDARYVEIELKILDWVGKPVLLVLNQVGPGRSQARSEAEVALWRSHLAVHSCIQGALSLDAFGRCWVQEDKLFAQIEAALSQELKPAGARLRAAWQARNWETFQHSMQALSHQLASLAIDEESFERPDLSQKLRGWMSSTIMGNDGDAAQVKAAQNAMVERLNAVTSACMGYLIKLHGLSGSAATEPLQELARELAVERPLDQHKAGLWGGLVSGAAGGIAADVATGGLTFGAGALIGGIVGALGAVGAVQAYNVARGRDHGRLRWSPDFLNRRVAAALLSYLAVAHFGRGRGEFIRVAVPDHFQQALGSLAQYRAQLETVWQDARKQRELAQTEQQLLAPLTALAREVLIALYPDSQAALTQPA